MFRGDDAHGGHRVPCEHLHGVVLLRYSFLKIIFQ